MRTQSPLSKSEEDPAKGPLDNEETKLLRFKRIGDRPLSYSIPVLTTEF